MKKRKIKFTDKKHSRNGILSTILGAVSAGLLFCLLAAAYLTSGQAGKAVAVLGLLAFFVACAGAWYGVLGRRERILTGCFRILESVSMDCFWSDL